MFLSSRKKNISDIKQWFIGVKATQKKKWTSWNFFFIMILSWDIFRSMFFSAGISKWDLLTILLMVTFNYFIIPSYIVWLCAHNETDRLKINSSDGVCVKVVCPAVALSSPEQVSENRTISFLFSMPCFFLWNCWALFVYILIKNNWSASLKTSRTIWNARASMCFRDVCVR